MRVSFVIFCILLGGITPLFCQQYHFNNYGVEDGLSQSQVLDLYQDEAGYLWIATSGGGVNRFGGQKFENFSTQEGFCGISTNVIYQDREDNFWFGTQSHGVCIYNGRSFRHIGQEKGLPHPWVNDIVETSEGVIWIATREGLCRYQEDSLTVFAEQEGLPRSRIKALKVDTHDRLWIGTSKGVTLYQNDSFRTYQTPESKKKVNVWHMAWGRDRQSLWLGCYRQGLFQFTGDTFVNLIAKYQLPKDLTVYEVFEDQQGRLWAGTDRRGVYCLFDSTYLHFTESNGLAGNRVKAITQDREGNIWIGSNQGISAYQGNTFVTWTPREGLAHQAVNNIYEDHRHDLWFATARGVTHYRPGDHQEKARHKIYTKQEGLPHNRVWDIAQGPDRDIWMATYHGLSHLQNGQLVTYTRQNSPLANNIVYDLYLDQQNRFWIGTDNGIHILRDSARFMTFDQENGLPSYESTRIRTIAEDEEGNLWFGTLGGGILIYNGQQFVQYKKKDGLGGNIIFTICPDQEGTMWVGSYGGGITECVPKTGELKYRFNTFGLEDGLTQPEVLAMKTDPKNQLWIGTIRGVYSLDVDQYDSTGVANFRYFGKHEGFRGIECVQNAICKDHRGNIWFGTVKGAVRYKPGSYSPNTHPPRMHITDVQLFRKKTDWSRYADSVSYPHGLPAQLTLPYDKNHLTFRFLGVSLTNPKEVKYRYRLKGVEKKWSPPIRKQFVTYSDLSPGQYEFQVKACNNHEIWNRSPARFSFTIEPPFWQTWWFYTVSGVIVLLGFISFHKIRSQHLQRRQKHLQQEVDRQTHQLIRQKEKIEEINRDLTDNITYAQNIQEAILPDINEMKQDLSDVFIYYRPRDIVSGDFYWFYKNGKKLVVTAVDCTGHGVPGAFMSMISNELLNEVVIKRGYTDPKKILEEVDQGIIYSLHQGRDQKSTPDGMDIALCTIHLAEQKIEFAGAKNPLFRVRDGKLTEIPGDIYPVGGHFDQPKEFTHHEQSYQSGDMFYLFSDGYYDQFGGADNKKFMKPRFKSLCRKAASKSIGAQEKLFHETFEQWRGSYEQVDDVLIIGFRL